ncbi:MAG TPA: hypothetical protein VEL07_14360, partial [Planctomycetota bacterium]|nr:hypothetical protein [Planctomycetota bacterium]
VGTSQATVCQVVLGRTRPKLSKIGKWADALGLEGEARASFLEEAALTHAPPEVVELVERLRSDLDRCRKKTRVSH